MPLFRLRVRVTPRASRDAIEPAGAAGLVRIRVTAPPVEGAANAAVVRLLAAALGVPARDIVLVGGGSAREKTFEVPLDEATVRKRLRGVT